MSIDYRANPSAGNSQISGGGPSYDDPNPAPAEIQQPWPDNTFAWTDNVDDVTRYDRMSPQRPTDVQEVLPGFSTPVEPARPRYD